MLNDRSATASKVEKVISIGYEGRTVDGLVRQLKECGVRELLDVRELPLSRKPGFSKKTLSETLEANGINYRHIREAGNPYRREKADVVRCLQLYAKHLNDNPGIVAQVAACFGEYPVAVLCFERDHRCCHRSVLLRTLTKSGAIIQVLEV